MLGIVLLLGCTTAVDVSSTTTSSSTIASSTTDPPPVSLTGPWDLVEYSEGGSTVAVEVGVNTREVPRVVITETGFFGNLGCNQFDGDGVGYEVTQERLVPGQVAVTDMGCGSDELMQVEDIFREAVWSPEILLSVDEDSMKWTANGVEFWFRR